ncbi:hypothetical protein ACFL1N_04635 [Thermodesulfobacteriota bacterium]
MKNLIRQDEQDVKDIFCLSGRKAKRNHFLKTIIKARPIVILAKPALEKSGGGDPFFGFCCHLPSVV